MCYSRCQDKRVIEEKLLCQLERRFYKDNLYIMYHDFNILGMSKVIVDYPEVLFKDQMNNQ